MKVPLVTNLKRKATEILGALASDREPVLRTQPSCLAAYLLDVAYVRGHRVTDRATGGIGGWRACN